MDESQATLEDALVHEVWRLDLCAIQRLLRSGANPNLPGRTWSSAIACAAENDATGDIVRLLVANGADVNLQNEQGLTPLHYAVDVAIDGTIQQNRESIDWSVVDVLLELGAEPNIRDARGQTVYEIASAYGYNSRRSFDNYMRSRGDSNS